MTTRDRPRSRKLTVTPLVELREQAPGSLLQLTAFGHHDEVRVAIETAAGVTLRRAAGYAETGASGCTVFWYGPGAWLLHCTGAVPPLRGAGHCSITDMSDSRFLFSISGIAARRFVASGCAVDVDRLHPGDALLTRFDHFDVLLHCLEPDRFDIYVERSYGDCFRDVAIRRAATMTVHVDATE